MQQEVQIQLINVISQVVSVNKFIGEKNHNKLEMDVSKLDKGIYTVIIQSGDEQKVRMWVKN